ncbi:MAG: hypothetical protein J1G38_00225 [Clostridiales bacterium]|nr:hypothetical protein [Clostridiales bacterium]
MKKSSYIGKIICAATATALCAIPLLACVDDNGNGELSSEKITAQQKEDYYMATYLAKNYTDTSKEYGENGKLTAHTVIKYNIDNYLLSIDDKLTNRMVYWFFYPADEGRVDYYWCIIINNYSKQWEVTSSLMHTLNSTKRAIGKRVATTVGCAVDMDHISRSTYSETDKTYIYETPQDSYKLYFSKKHFYAYTLTRKTEPFSLTAVSSDFGKTKVNVPAEVKKIAEDYKATHEPPIDEED